MGPGRGLPKFFIVKIPGVPAEKAFALLDAQMEDDAGVPVFEKGARTIYRRKAWRVAINNIPAAIRNQILATGSVTVTVSQIRNYLRRIRDGAQFTGLD